jgi:hypothetical protein
MEYYLFMEQILARKSTHTYKCEWLVNGEWKMDSKMTLALEDALHDYGDYGIGDQDRKDPEMEDELIQNGTIILKEEIDFGTF